MESTSRPSARERTCALCGNPKPLENSHILSEFLHYGMYDANHRFWGLDINAKKISIHQKGLREHLLCHDCEQQFGRYERYARDIFIGEPDLTFQAQGKQAIFTGVEYASMKLFFLSIIWRLAVTSLRHLKGADLGVHTERLRLMLVAEEPGRFDKYPCFITAVVFNRRSIPDLILAPIRARLDGHSIWHVTVGGFVFSYYISNHSPPHILHPTFLSETGELRLLVREITDIEFLHRAAFEISKSGMPELVRKKMGS